MKSITMDKSKVLEALQANRAKAMEIAQEGLTKLRRAVLDRLAEYANATMLGETREGHRIAVFNNAIKMAEASAGDITMDREDYVNLIEGRLLEECDCPACRLSAALATGNPIKIIQTMMGFPSAAPQAGDRGLLEPDSKQSDIQSLKDASQGTEPETEPETESEPERDREPAGV